MKGFSPEFSPVVMTIIVVAAAIVLSIVAALWITGLTSSFTGVEKLETMQTRIIYVNHTLRIELLVKNTGTKEITIEHVYVNDVEVPFSIDHSPLKPGETSKVNIVLEYDKYTPNEKIAVKLVTNSNTTYTVELS